MTMTIMRHELCFCFLLAGCSVDAVGTVESDPEAAADAGAALAPSAASRLRILGGTHAFAAPLGRRMSARGVSLASFSGASHS